jgi:hypothetical protein
MESYQNIEEDTVRVNYIGILAMSCCGGSSSRLMRIFPDSEKQLMMTQTAFSSAHDSPVDKGNEECKRIKKPY